jgi:predicted  nucleic acid-binding Zn-ribbon protein
MPFRCEKCKKEFPVGTHYIGSGGYDKTCPDCAEYRFEKVKEYIKALKVIGKFHKQILKKFQKEIATANISAKL